MAAQAWSPAGRGARLRVDVTQVLADPKAALTAVLDATPGWQDGASAEAVVEQISGAMTNLVFRCSSPAARHNAAVIVRVFGSGGKLFSQRDERNIFLLASDLGLGPKCLVEYENGRVEEFLPGDNLSCETMREPDVSAAIAAAMARFHVRMLAGLTSAPPAQQQQQQQQQQQAGAANGQLGQQQPAGPQLRPAIYERIRKWHAAAAECGADLQAAGLSALPQELDVIQSRLAALYPPWVAFCHNDLQYGNMLLMGAAPSSRPGGASPPGGRSAPTALRGGSPRAGDPVAATLAAAAAALAGRAAAGGGGGGEPAASGGLWVKLIDYEYSTLNDAAYDVANHFCEWAYNYHSDEAHMFKDSWLPSEAQQLHFCRAYMAAMWEQLQLQQAAAAAQQAAGEQAAGAAAQQAAGEQAAGAAAATAGDHTPPAKRQAMDAAATAAAGAACSLPAAIFSAAADAPGSRSGGGDSGSGAAAVEAAAQLLLAKAQAHLPLVHLKWGLWGLVQDKMSDVEFDYLSYGQQRIERYHAAKRALLAS